MSKLITLDCEGQCYFHILKEHGTARQREAEPYFLGYRTRLRGLNRDEDSMSCSELDVVKIGVAKRF